jgi:Tfp pilus assembly protein PilF
MVNLAKFYWRRGEVEQADRFFVAAIEGWQPKAPGWVMSDYAGFLTSAMNDLERAAEYHNRAASDPQFPTAKARYAWFVAQYQNDTTRAKVLMDEAVSSEPKTAETMAYAAQLEWQKTGNMEAARAKIATACALDQNNRDALAVHGEILLECGEPANAVYYYRRAVKRGVPEHVIACNYGLSLLLTGKTEGAIRLLNRTSRARPKNALIRACLALASYVGSQQPRAIKHASDVLDANPESEAELIAHIVLTIADPQLASIHIPQIADLLDRGTKADERLISVMCRQSDRRDLGLLLQDAVTGRISARDLSVRFEALRA